MHLTVFSIDGWTFGSHTRNTSHRMRLLRNRWLQYIACNQYPFCHGNVSWLPTKAMSSSAHRNGPITGISNKMDLILSLQKLQGTWWPLLQLLWGQVNSLASWHLVRHHRWCDFHPISARATLASTPVSHIQLLPSILHYDSHFRVAATDWLYIAHNLHTNFFWQVWPLHQ